MTDSNKEIIYFWIQTRILGCHNMIKIIHNEGKNSNVKNHFLKFNITRETHFWN